MCKVLIFGCVAAAILMTAAYGAPHKTKLKATLEALISDLALLKDIPENDYLNFYTPNDKQECNQATLSCFLKELKVLEEDVEEKYETHVSNIEKNLEDIKDPDFSNPTCKKCEFNEKKKFPEFHQELTSFLQSMWKEIV